MPSNSPLYSILFIIGFFIINSCEEKVMLTKEQYTDIILDLQVAETIIINAKVQNKDSLRSAFQNRICEIYHFKDKASLKRALQPLESDPDLMLEITKVMSKKLDELADSAIVSQAN